MANIQYSDQPIGGSPLRSWPKYGITGSTVLADVYKDYSDFPKKARPLGDLSKRSWLSAQPETLDGTYRDYSDFPKRARALSDLPDRSFVCWAIQTLSVSFPNYADRPRTAHPLPSMPVYSFVGGEARGVYSFVGGETRDVSHRREYGPEWKIIREDEELIEIMAIILKSGILN